MIDNDTNSDDASTSSMEENETNHNEEEKNNVRNNSNIARIFQQNEVETKNDCVLLNVRRSIREFIFPKIKFINNDALSRVRLMDENSILHILLRELNRLDDNMEKRARFWLRYKSQVSAVLTARKTEIEYFRQVVCEHLELLLEIKNLVSPFILIAECISRNQFCLWLS